MKLHNVKIFLVLSYSAGVWAWMKSKNFKMQPTLQQSNVPVLSVRLNIKSNLSSYSQYYAEACNDLAVPISASLRPGNTASF